MNCIVTHENNLVADGRLGKFYKYVNNKINGSNGIGSHKSPSGEMLYSDRDKAVLLNDYFSSVFTIDNGVIDTTKLPVFATQVGRCYAFCTVHSIHGCQVY